MKSGRSSDPIEFLNRAVYHYVIARDLAEEYSAEEIDKLIDEGLEDFRRGDIVEGEEAFRQLRANSTDRRRQRA